MLGGANKIEGKIDNAHSIAVKLAEALGGEVVTANSGYGRIVVAGSTLAYVNAGYLDFKAEDVAKAPAGARAKLTNKGKRVHLPIGEKRAAATLLRHVKGEKGLLP
jgi:hypothetical protein